MHTPANVDEVKQAVLSRRQIQVSGGGSKPALSSCNMPEATINTSKLSGVTAYDPGEYTFTALAGTPLREIRDMLADHHQFLAFDPPLVDAGATLGGTVAAGLSGAGRLRYGGIRDFLLGCLLVTGEGRVVFGGGKVVKNAAGFDIPKLMVGARGAYGVMAELTFKVFPLPEAYVTLEVECGDSAAALRLQSTIASSPLEPACLDLLPPARLLIRVGGLAAALPARVRRLRELCRDARGIVEHEDDKALWRAANEFAWCADAPLLARIPLTPNEAADCDNVLATGGFERRYSVAGNLAWFAATTEVSSTTIDQLSRQLGRSITLIRGPQFPPAATTAGDGFRRRLRSVFDPQNKFSQLGCAPLG